LTFTLFGTVRPCHGSDEKHVYYLQSQNGNLYSEDFFSDGEDASEFAALRADVPPEVNFVRDALDRTPDAVNMWIGGSDSVTSIHSGTVPGNLPVFWT
jgi:jumonji domain-containing protein 7